jgi:hypothetical protein
LHALLARAPEEFCEQLRILATPELVAAVARLRPGTLATVAATEFAMRQLAHRWQALQAEIDRLNQALRPLLRTVAPSLLAFPGWVRRLRRSCWRRGVRPAADVADETALAAGVDQAECGGVVRPAGTVWAVMACLRIARRVTADHSLFPLGGGLWFAVGVQQ